MVVDQQLYDRQLPVLCSQEQRRCVSCVTSAVSLLRLRPWSGSAGPGSLLPGARAGNDSNHTGWKDALRVLTVIQGIYIGASLQQQATNVYMTVHGCPVQCSILQVVTRAHIGATSCRACDIPGLLM